MRPDFLSTMQSAVDHDWSQATLGACVKLKMIYNMMNNITCHQCYEQPSKRFFNCEERIKHSSYTQS